MTKENVANEGARQKPTRKTKWGGDRQSTWKRLQNNDSKDDPRSQIKNRDTDWEDTRKV